MMGPRASDADALKTPTVGAGRVLNGIGWSREAGSANLVTYGLQQAPNGEKWCKLTEQTEDMRRRDNRSTDSYTAINE